MLKSLVEPLRNKWHIIEVEKWLAQKSASSEYFRRRNQLIWVIGVSTGLRVSDVLNLSISDVRGESRILVREKNPARKKRCHCQIKL